jgi:protein KTI12
MDQTKRECYLTSQTEKSTRSAIKACVDRYLTKSSDDKTTQSKRLVIVDSLNYIKGYRYELHCLSKAAREKHGVIWVLNSSSVAKKWNQKRSQQQPDAYYTEQQMEELQQRYEPPDARNRWDKPLYRIDLTPSTTTATLDSTASQAAEEALAKSVYNMHALSKAIHTEAAAGGVPTKKSAFRKKKPAVRPNQQQQQTKAEEQNHVTAEPQLLRARPDEESSTTMALRTQTIKSLEEQLDDILDSFLLDVAPLQEGVSTRQHLNAESNVLHQVDSITQQVCNAILAFQKHHAMTGGSIMTLEGFCSCTTPLTLQTRRTISLTELKRLRRQYIQWVASHPPEDTSERGIAESFVQYVQNQVQ